MEHVGSAHDEQELEALKTAAEQRLAFLYLDLGLDSLEGVDGGGLAGEVESAGPGPFSPSPLSGHSARVIFPTAPQALSWRPWRHARPPTCSVIVPAATPGSCGDPQVD